MTATRNHLSIRTARANALFVSTVQRSEQPGARQVRRSTAAALRQFGAQGSAERVAQDFGDHPEVAASRMRWARQAAAAAFGEQISELESPQPGPRLADQPVDSAA